MAPPGQATAMPLSNLAIRDIETLAHPNTNLALLRETGPLVIERGKVEVESEGTDRGTTVSIHLPMKASACARFMTVLGPGSDGYHEEHIHVDLAERSNNYRICHWEVRDPPPPIPLPRPRPVIAQDGAKEAPEEAPGDTEKP